MENENLTQRHMTEEAVKQLYNCYKEEALNKLLVNISLLRSQKQWDADTFIKSMKWQGYEFDDLETLWQLMREHLCIRDEGDHEMAKEMVIRKYKEK